MTPREALRVALRALSANKLRAALTMLGIVIGVAAVITLVAVGRGAQVAVTQQIQALGTNVVFIRPGSTLQSGVRQAQGSASTLTVDDALALPRQVPAVVATAPEVSGSAQLVANSQNWNTRVLGTTASYQDVRNVRVATGEFISAQHDESRASVVVLGATPAANLFPTGSPLGQTVRVSLSGRPGVNFRVIGVMESKGGTGFGNQDDQVLVPLSTYQMRLSATRNTRGALTVATINAQVAEGAAIRTVTREVAEVLRERHRVPVDDFTIQSQEDFLQTASQVTGTMTVLLGSIAGISLLVGGIGIMNIMLVSVTERTREIGIRKAVGARRRDILLQFIMEATMVSVLGGLVGMSLGVGLAQVVGRLRLPGPFGSALVTADAVLLALGVSIAVGLFFGIYPATRAAALRPIEALRYE